MNEITALKLPVQYEPWQWVRVVPLSGTLPGLVCVWVPLYITTEES